MTKHKIPTDQPYASRRDLRTADAAWRNTRHSPLLNPPPRSTWNGRRIHGGLRGTLARLVTRLLTALLK